MKARWTIVVRDGIVFSKVITAHNLTALTESTSECGVIISNARINHRDRLTGPIKTILSRDPSSIASGVF